MPSKRSKSDLARTKAAKKGRPPAFRRKGPKFSQKRDDIVLEIVELINACEFIPYKTNVELAAKHGVSKSVVRDCASQASRHIRLCLDEGDARAEVLAGIKLGIRLSLKAKRQQYDQVHGCFRTCDQPEPDRASLARFLQMQMDVHGLSPRQDDPKGEDAGVDVQVEELAALVEEARKRAAKG